MVNKDEWAACTETADESIAIHDLGLASIADRLVSIVDREFL